MKGEVTAAEMVKGIFEHQYTATSDSTTQPKTTRTATIFGQAGFRVGIESRPVIAKKTKRTRGG
jgi:hypothetical protein